MRKNTARIVFIVLMVSLIAGLPGACTSRPVAVVNGKAVDSREFERHLKEKLRSRPDQANVRHLRTEAVNELIIEQLILEEALRHGITASEDEAKKAVEQTRRNMGERAFERHLKERGMDSKDYLTYSRKLIIMTRFRAALERQHPVTEAEVRDHYRNSPMPFIRPPKSFVKIVEMLSDEEARAAMRQIRRDKIEFDVMAERLSAGGKASVTDYGWVRPGYFSQPVAQAIMNLGIGQSGGPYKGRKGYLLIRVKDREQETIAPFEEVKEEIRAKLREQRSQNVFAMWLDQKKRSSTITVHLN